MRLQLRLTTTAVAFSRPAEAGEYRLFSRRAYKRFAQRTGQRSRRRRSERKRTLPFCPESQMRSAWQNGQRSRRRRSERKRTLPFCPESRMRSAWQNGQRSRRRRSERKRTLQGTFHRIIDSGIGLQKNSAGNNRQSLRLLFMLVSYRLSGWYFAVLPAVHDI